MRADEGACGVHWVLRGLAWECSVLEEVEVEFEETWACLRDLTVRGEDEGVVGAGGVEGVVDVASEFRVHTSHSKIACMDLVGTYMDPAGNSDSATQAQAVEEAYQVAAARGVDVDQDEDLTDQRTFEGLLDQADHPVVGQERHSAAASVRRWEN